MRSVCIDFRILANMDLNNYTVLQLKEVLRGNKLSTVGNKNELIVRVQEAHLEGELVRESESVVASENGHEDEVIEQEIPLAMPGQNIQNASDGVQNDLLRELEYMRREQLLMEREVRVLERENQLLRGASTSQHKESPVTEMPSKINIKAISEILDEFNGSPGFDRNWKKRARLLISTYHLDDKSTKIMLGMRLKEKALEWFHSRPEHIGSVEELFSSMQQMFLHPESKLKLRKQFEERVWVEKEPFATYYHDKLILENRVPIIEDEILEYLVEGISNVQLRNQAKLQKFKSKRDLLSAFETIDLKESKGSSERASKGSAKEQKDIGSSSTSSTVKESSREKGALPKKIRCYNCNLFGHISKDCKAVKREKGSCFKCGEKGHTINDCKGKTESDQISYVSAKQIDNDFQKLVKDK